MNAIKKELDEQEFLDVLNDTYEDVTICGLEMSQGDILKECDPIAFQCAKNDYESESDSVPWECGVCGTEHDTEEGAENCCKVSHLLNLLESAGFIGIDASITESLLTYALVYRELDGLTLLCANPKCKDEIEDIDDILFQFEVISKDDIQNAIYEQSEGFFDFIGTTRAEYTLDSIPLVIALSDILQYCSGWLIESLEYPLNIDDVIQSLKAGDPTNENTK